MKLTGNTSYFTYYGALSAFFSGNPQNDGKEFFVRSISSCRESFSSYLDQNSTHIGYIASNSPTLKLESFTKFWRMIEEMLGLPQEKIEAGSMDHTFTLELDKFWTPNPFRRGMLTLLLRMGVVYYDQPGRDKNTIEELIAAYRLASYIPNTINHFLAGHTTPTFNDLASAGSLVSYFQGFDGDPEALKKKLVKLITK